MDIKDILDNESVKGLFSKLGVTDDQAKSVADQAMSSIQSKFKENPKQMSSLLSENENTEDDLKMSSAIEEDFMSGLIKKVGLPEGIADKIKGMMPNVLSQFSGNLSANGKNSESGIAGMLGGLTGFLDADGDGEIMDDIQDIITKKSGGLSGLFSKLFGKK